MKQLSIGDYVCNTFQRQNGTIINDRGGYVGRWGVKLDNGDFVYASTRDLTLITPARPHSADDRMSTEEKLNMLLDYLGLEILDEPKIIKREPASDDVS